MTKKWERFSDEELEQKVKESTSYRSLAANLGYAPDGGTGPNAAKEMVKIKGFNVDHFTGQGWNKGNFDYSRFQYGIAMRPSSMSAALINLRGNACEECGITEWQDKPIVLEVHHIDGDHLNNVLDNLQLLCPNCHSQTENYKHRGSKKKEYTDEEYIEALKQAPNIRQALLSLGLNGSGANYKRANDLIYEHQITHLIK